MLLVMPSIIAEARPANIITSVRQMKNGPIRPFFIYKVDFNKTQTAPPPPAWIGASQNAKI